MADECGSSGSEDEAPAPVAVPTSIMISIREPPDKESASKQSVPEEIFGFGEMDEEQPQPAPHFQRRLSTTFRAAAAVRLTCDPMPPTVCSALRTGLVVRGSDVKLTQKCRTLR
jgi:hypothetical protein